MKSIFAAFAVAMTALATSATLSAAQQYDDVPPPQDQQQPGGVPQSGVGSENCLRLEAQLAGLGRAKANDPAMIRQQLARQQAELERSQAQYKQMSCGPRFIFAPAPPAECGPLGDRIKQMQANLERAQSQASQPPQQDPRRRELLIALARGQCGPQYRLVERRVATQQPEQRKGFFEMLFGGGGNDSSPREETVIEPEMDGGEAPRVSTYRTVCVRACDGFFFPISFQTSRNAFERDQAICQATCPGAEAKLYAYPNPGGQMEQAVDIEGQPYTSLQNAFKYRKEFVAGCSCKPEGMSWAEALQGVDDKTVKKGDIVVDEQKAHELSQPGSQAQATSPRNQQRPRLPNQPQPAQSPAQPSGAPQDLAPPPPDAQPATGSTRGQPSDDVIILNQPPLDRSRIQGRPLDGPAMQRQP